MPALINSNDSIEPLAVFLPLLTDALLAPTFLIVRKLGSAIFMIGAVLFIVTAILTSIFSGVPTSSSLSFTDRSFTHLNRTSRSSENLHWFSSSLEAIKSEVPAKIESILKKFSLDIEECPQYLEHELSCVAYEYYPELTSSVHKTFGSDSFWYKFMDEKSQRFVDLLLDGASCKLKSFKCSTISILFNLQDRFAYKMFGSSDSPPSPSTTTTTTTTTTASTTSTTTTPKPVSPIKPNETAHKLFILVKNYVEKMMKV